MTPPFWPRLLLFFAGAALCIVGYLFLLSLPALGPASPTAGIIPALFIAIGMLGLTARLLHLDGLSLGSLGIELSGRAARHFGIGLSAGAVLVGGWMGIVTVATGATWHLNDQFRPVALVGWFAFALCNNAGEELVYRGYAFVRIAERHGAAVAVTATTAIFALFHLQAGLPWLSVVAGVLTSGLIFAVVFERWRSLPLALGLHVATNLFQDAVGLRLTAASVMAPTWPSTGLASAMDGALIACAVLNLLVVLALVRLPRPIVRAEPRRVSA